MDTNPDGNDMLKHVPALLLLTLVGWSLSGCLARAPEGAPVPVWGRWEAAFEATADADPWTELSVELTAPDGGSRTVRGFWDGGRTWRVRFMPDAPGTWTYRTATQPAVDGLSGEEGRFMVVEAADTATVFLQHGPVHISDEGHYLAHRDGTPFFWLGDTAWNGALRSTEEDWATYLADRAGKGFSVIQFVTTQWRAAHTDAEGNVAYVGYDSIQVNPAFFQRLDRRVDAVNEAGLLAAPVLLWALGEPEQVPGKLPEEQAIRLARYLTARYGAHHVAWILGGDENYSGANAERWLRIGRGVFDEAGHAPVTLHPQGMQWHFDPFLDEPWLTLLIYQSGHGDDAETLRWIHSGPPSQAWQQEPIRPIINAEPPYEDHVAYQSRQPHSAYNVRRAVYWSLLNAPTAGVTYGAHGIWSWETEPAEPLNHEGSGVAKPWQEAMELPGSTHMQYVADLFGAIEWWTLRPAPELLAAQPGDDDPAHFAAAARSEAGDLAVLYLPVGGTVTLDPELLAGDLPAAWFNPRDGSRTPAEPSAPSTYTAPDTNDWVLVFGGA